MVIFKATHFNPSNSITSARSTRGNSIKKTRGRGTRSKADHDSIMADFTGESRDRDRPTAPL